MNLGRYQLLTPLGAGADGVAYRAEVIGSRPVEHVEKRGAKFHWARDAEEANAIILRLAKERNARSIVKSKSMTTEETHLNKALEAADIKVVETDLGEYNIQLAHETPSHIIVPAIHKTKRQIAELFG